MAREFAKAFYNSAAWKTTSKAYAASKFFLCEKCSRQGYIVHHKEALTPSNISDPAVALGWNNLMYLCLDCHNAVHGKQDGRQAVFDANGNMVGIVEAPPNCV